MATHHTSDVSEEIYHRIYRLIKRRVNAHTIAATLHLPLRTVHGVINRLEKMDPSSEQANISNKNSEKPSDTNEYLDIYFYPKTRYAILDLVGALSDQYTEQLKTEFDKVLKSSWKAVAIRMSDVYSLSEAASGEILSASKKFVALGRYMAILDPSTTIEPAITHFKLETAIPIFGTERAFEDAAFAKKGKMFGRRGSQPSA